ncbi:MAG TPA: efflux RND transporter periplasmic adaptor subunit [Verrucomicrobiae bacterium]|nr:efflux RND transporter periplasmic adaptor subunit [Verrucomicrobiae bacterium]
MKGLSLLAFTALLGCHRTETAKIPEPPEPKVQGETVSFPTDAPQLSSFAVQPAEARKLAITHLTGRLYWNDDVTVRVFTPVAGRVVKVDADLGDRVSPGSPLAEIDSPDFGQVLANARTAVGNLAAADKAYTRSKELLAHGAAAEKDVEAAQAAYVAALAERDRAEAVLENYGGTLKATNSVYTLRSQLAGEVVDKNVNPGQELRADLMLANAPSLFAPQFVVSDPTTLWVQVDVAETDLASIQPGMKLRVTSRAFSDRVFEGRIEKIGDTMDPATRTVKVRGVVNNPDKLLKAEMYVMVDIIKDLSQVADAGVDVPAKAIFMKQDESFLFVESAPGQFERKRVKVGAEKDGKVPVFDGVAAGQKVVSEGALLLQSLVEPTS